MKTKLLKDKDFWISLVYFCIAVLAIVLFVLRLCEWNRPEWFFTPSRFNPYTTVNVVSRWADFAYFTYISQLIFCLWAILRFIAILFNLEKLKKFTNNSYVVLFICLNQFIVMLIYSLSQCMPGQNFGLYATHARAIKNFALNLFHHYFVTIASTIYFFIHKHSKVEFKKCLLFLPFLVIYAAIVKITGMFCYSFEWYPYPIFTAKSIWYNIFGTLESFNMTYAILILMAVILLILVIYVLLLLLASKIVNKRAKK